MKIEKEDDISQSVANFLLRGRALLQDKKTRIRCGVALREFMFGNSKFDVVGFSDKEGTFYIVECKYGSHPVSIGHAFGQILAYKCIIEERGYEFLEEFLDELLRKPIKRVKPQHVIDLTKKKHAKFKFYVALREKACRRYKLLKMMKKSLPEVGIIRVNNNGACRLHIHGPRGTEDYTLCDSMPVSITFKKKYRSRKSFFEELEKELKTRINESFKDFKANKNDRNVKQFWYHTSSIHYEVWFGKKEGKIELGLHMESSAKRNDELYRYLMERKEELKEKIGSTLKIEKWLGRKIEWARAVVRYPWDGSYRNLDEDLMETLAKKMVVFIETLNPILADFLNR